MAWQRFAFAEILFVIVADQITKFLAFNAISFPEGGSRVVLPFFSIVHWWNRGVSFGMFNGPHAVASQFGILVILTLLIVILLMYSLTHSRRPLSICAFGIIIGGALGNLMDRFHYGAVADFLYFHWHEHGFPAFNLADSCVCVGVALLLLDGFLSQKRETSASFIDSE